MKKIKLYILSFIFLSIFVLSLNKPFMEWWVDYRTFNLHFPPTLARYGDLYSNCFLHSYIDTAAQKLKEYKTKINNIDLYILHDSYLAGRIKKENFIGLDKLIPSDFRGDGICVYPDTTKKNILIIECSERTAGWRLTDTSTAFSKMTVRKKILTTDALSIIKHEELLNYFFNPNINQNLEFNLFDYELFRSLKELKALLNFNLFNRHPKDVEVSTDKKYLLLAETVDPSYTTSSFREIPGAEIDFITNHINIISTYYKKQGFDEVYFSIVPNPVSIIDANRLPYNHKIERIENNWMLKTKYVDIYSIFKNCNYQLYRKDDSHWNNRGIQLWIDKVNKQILLGENGF